MNGTNLNSALSTASISVLETMFFTEGTPLDAPPPHVDPLACLLHCSGALEGTFSIALDRTALIALCQAFYGEEAPSATQVFELLCELTNMIAGSTLSAYLPTHYCALTSPQLCDVAVHMGSSMNPSATFLCLAVDGGVISIACSIRKK